MVCDVCLCGWTVRSEVAWPETRAQTWGEQGLSGERVYQHRHQWKSEWGPLSRRNSSGVGGMSPGKREREKEGEGQGKDCSEQTDCPFSLISHSFFYRKLRSERERRGKEKRTRSLPAIYLSLISPLSFSLHFIPSVYFCPFLSLFLLTSFCFSEPCCILYTELNLASVKRIFNGKSVATENNLSFCLQKYEQKLHWQ